MEREIADRQTTDMCGGQRWLLGSSIALHLSETGSLTESGAYRVRLAV